MNDIGAQYWVIPEGYIPGSSTGKKPEMESHDSVSILNLSGREAHIALTLYFADKNPVGPYKFTVPAQRSKHVRYNNLEDPERVPRDTPYSSTVESDVPVVVQYTRLDSRQAENALLSTMAFPAPGGK